MRAALLTLAAGLALAGCTGSIAPLSRTHPTENPGKYFERASAYALFEAQAAQLAVVRAQRADVRAYAQTLVDRQPVVAEKLASGAAGAGLAPEPAALTSSQARMLADLESEPAESFDELYLRQQLSVQRAAMKVHSAYALAGDAAPLRPVAETGSGKAYQHYQEVRRLRRAQG